MYNGYDGQPPFRPPPMNLPPFPPNLGPGGQPGPGSPYPPFPPPNGFARPPFAPNLPSAPQQPPMGYNNGSPLPIRPMPGQGQMQMPYNNSPMRPPHPGLGLPPTPNNLPIPPHRQPGSNFIKAVKTTTVFVGSIAPGIDNSTISELLNACGPLYDLKRVVGAGGKLQAFGFAQFESPEVVMRCIRCLHGVELPDMTPEGRRERKPAKPLVVKVDDKTREFLDEFEATVGRTEDDETADADARKLVAQIVARIIDPHAPTPDQPTRRSGGQSPITVIVPAHLQDLREGDLPENQRVAVLDQISLFRENAARKERLKKALEEEQELARLQAPTAYKKPPNPQEYGYGTRVFSKTTPYQAPPSRGDQNQSQNQGGQSGPVRHDPQGYGRPVDFVKAQTAEAKAQSGRTDEEEEQSRQMKLARDREGILRDRERQVEHRERLRLENLNRELTHRRQQSEMEQRSYRNVSERLDQFDDDEVAERGKEWFYSDRNRWRNARQQQRTREYQDDVRDRQAEQDEIRAIERESEEFLKRQMEEMTRMEEEQKQRGLLTEDAAPIKLDLNTKPAAAAPVPAAKIDSKPQPKARPAIAFEADDEEEVAADKRKQRTFVKLDYDEKAVAKMTEAEKVAMRNAQLLDIKSQISKDRRTLWGVNLDWKAINEKTTKAKVLGFVNSKLVEYLGEVDQDLADFIMENIAERKRPDAMVEGLEPVLAEDAVTLVIQLWRLLAFETAAAKAGLQSGNMLV